MIKQEKKTGIPKSNKIFTNRTLNLARIQMIGFDMDHTLAPYHRKNFESLAFRETLKKFIDAGYPEELSTLEFKDNFVIRGLLVDKHKGNILKVDTHKYVKDAYHGHRQLSKMERHKLYNSKKFDVQSFLSIDTFFALSEVQLFVEIIDFMEKNPGKISQSFIEVYNDLRKFIDISHRDGSIKNKVMADPEKYIVKDKQLATALKRLINGGKSLFLLTNSRFEYTNVIMNYILGDQSPEYSQWQDFWKYIIVGAGKPGFFIGSQPFFEVVPESGLLKINEDEIKTGKIYHGGNAYLFEQLTGYRGDEILYVGDHIYGDIIRSKGVLNWRTMLIVEELEDEIPAWDKTKSELTAIKEKLVEREDLDEDIQKSRSLISANIYQVKKAQEANDEKKLALLKKNNENLLLKHEEKSNEIINLENTISQMIKDRAKQFHLLWGELMKVGLEKSRFANQVNNYACIYSSRVSNLRFYSPFKKFISPYEDLPHEY